MKAVFLVFHGLAECNGISKKIGYQVDALRQCGVATELCYFAKDSDGKHWLRKMGENVIDRYDDTAWEKMRKRVAYGSVVSYIKANGVDLLYIRGFNNSNPFVARMIEKVRKTGCKVVYEIPTYPYDGEYMKSGMKARIELEIDKVFRRYQASKVNYIVTYSSERRIFGAPTINISNGIDFEHIPVKDGECHHDEDEFHLIGVAEVHFWHGFDRVIRGMATYYKRGERVPRVYFHIVGYCGDDTMELLRHLVRANRLERYVIFEGPKYGEELTGLFDRSDMGVASLGRHRSNITSIKTLKNREYAARGIPFIYSEQDSDFDDKPYVMKAAPDESEIDIDKLIIFWRGCPMRAAEIRSSIAGLSWRVQMQKILDAM